MTKPHGLIAAEAPKWETNLPFPPVFAALRTGMERRALTAPFEIKGVTVFQTRIPPGSGSGVHHRHSRREEFVYILEGEATLVGDHGETVLSAGMCAGFRPGGAHHLENRGASDLVYLDITPPPPPGDVTEFPDDDLVLQADSTGAPQFTHRDGTPY